MRGGYSAETHTHTHERERHPNTYTPFQVDPGAWTAESPGAVHGGGEREGESRGELGASLLCFWFGSRALLFWERCFGRASDGLIGFLEARWLLVIASVFF